jgi:hypothetical protein
MPKDEFLRCPTSKIDHQVLLKFGFGRVKPLARIKSDQSAGVAAPPQNHSLNRTEAEQECGDRVSCLMHGGNAQILAGVLTIFVADL